MTMNDEREPSTDDGEQTSKRPTDQSGAITATDSDLTLEFRSKRTSVKTTDEGIAIVELAAGGAYDWEFRSELRRTWKATSKADPSVIVLTGEQGAFSITEDPDESGTEDSFGVKQERQATCDAAATLGMPVIAAPRGDVRGHGVTLALCADLRIGGETSEYGRAGVPASTLEDECGVNRLVATVGHERAQEFVASETSYDAQTMADWGMLNYVVSDGEVVDRAISLAETFAERPSDAYRHMKHAVRAATSITGNSPGVDAGSTTGSNRRTPASGDDPV